MNQNFELWIDATDFTSVGGWKTDTQYVHLMGAPYLIAAGEPGVPVADATVEITVPENGNYRVWVRDRNWMRQYSPGQFTLLVNGEDCGKRLGAMPSDRWAWEIAGDFELSRGEATVTLRDLTGYFARCSSILLTTDMDYVPSPELGRIYAERTRIRGLSDEVMDGGDFDVIVAGGGPGGVPAALASAREGLKVLLIQDRSILGGNGSSEVGITFDGAAKKKLFNRETGIAEEIRRLRDRVPAYSGDWTAAMEQLVAEEPNITLIRDTRVSDVTMDGNTIKSVTAMNILTLAKSRYTAKLFIDCTGDAWLGYYAGAKYRFGREAAYQHGETLAPALADTQTMSGCIKSGNRPFFFDTGAPVEYHAPEWVPRLPESDEEFGRRVGGARMHWWMEIPNTYDDMWDGEEARDALLLVSLGFYDHIKNHWSGKDRVKNYKMDMISVMNGRRESRRLIGDYILTQEDCLNGRHFDDSVSYTGWALDVHHPDGIYSGKEGPLYCAVSVSAEVPYRCLYSKNIENLLFAGRNVSVTHIALGTVRVQNTIATLGQAVGTAAALCIKHGEMPRGIYQRHMRELQQLLIKNDQFIPNVKNEDAGDPCLTATASASSFSKTEIMRIEHGTEGELIPLDTALMLFRPVISKEPINEVYVKLHSTNAEPTTVTLHAWEEGHDIDTFANPGERVTGQGVVPPMGESWVKIPLHLELDQHKYLDKSYIRVWIDPVDGISWRSMKDLSFYYLSGKRDENGKWKTKGSSGFRFATKEPIERLADCSPANVVNGWSRILDADRYEWVSDPTEQLPQWIALNFKTPTEINSVSVVFNTDLTDPATCWTSKIPEVPCCVKDYDVEIFDGSDWKTVASVSENFMRKRTHTFETTVVEKVRVTVRATWGDPSARVQEIRASLDQ